MLEPTTENINHEVTVILLKRIIELLDTKELPLESVDVDNLDEIKAHLRNELAPVIKSIQAGSDRSEVLKAIKALAEEVRKIDFKPTINVAGSEVTIPEIKVPEINIPTITVPTPQVTVNAPEVQIPAPIVNLPAPIVNMPEIDLAGVIKSLELNLNKLRTNSVGRPLAVRLSDGQAWVQQLKEVNSKLGQTIQYMSDDNYLKSSTGQRINPATSDGQAWGILVPTDYDYISLSPASQPTTVIYKKGGASGVTRATLTIAYSGTDVSSVTRT